MPAMAIHHRGGTIRRARFGGDCCPADWSKPRRRFPAADRLNQTTTFAYDHLHRQTSVTNANGEVTGFAYDALGQRTGLTDPEGNTTTWVYDGLNRVIEETNELNATRYFSYDANGNLIQKIDRNDRYSEFEYDNLHRLIEERWLDPADDTTVIHTINWAYDAYGQFLQVSDTAADYEYFYDGLGRATSIFANITGLTPAITFAQAYNANSRRTQLAATIGSTADFVNDFTFDNLNRQTGVTQQGVPSGNSVAEKRVNIGYNAAGQFSTLTRYVDLAASAFSAVSTYEYDGTGRLTALTHAKGATTFAGYGWTYDAANRITAFTNSEYSAEDATFNYDDAGQLVAADRAGTTDDEAYVYDENGNRVTANGQSYSTGTNNRLESDGVYNYEYDAEGNTTKHIRISDDFYTVYKWDHRNRLINVTDFDDEDGQLQQISYAYDALNRLVTRTVQEGTDPAVTGFFIYDGNQMTLALDDAVDVQHRLLWGPAVDQIFAEENSTGDVLWALIDHQNTVRDWAQYDDFLDETTIANHIAYDSFGRKLDETDDTLDVLPLEYTGRYFDDATGLQWNLNRWYNAETGRWMSEDPIGFYGQDANLNRYVGNEPVNFIDPAGLEWIDNIDGWDYSGMTIAEMQDEYLKNLTIADKFDIGRQGSAKLVIDFSVLAATDPKLKDKLSWLGGLIASRLDKLGASDASKHFKHYLSGKGNTDAPGLPVNLLKSTDEYKRLLAILRQKVRRGEGGKGTVTATFDSQKLRSVKYLMGDFKYSWELNDCEAKITVDDPYDFHLGKDASIEETVVKSGIPVTVVVRIPDAVILQFQAGLGAKPFDRKVEWVERFDKGGPDERPAAPPPAPPSKERW